MNYELKRQNSGAFALYNKELRETMHPKRGPWQEANLLYIDAGRFSPMLADGPLESPLVIFDVGLGGAANALAAIQSRENRLRHGLPCRPLRLVSFENDLAPLIVTLEQAEALEYPVGSELALEALLNHGEWQKAGVSWSLRLGDFKNLIHEETERAELIFFDPFSPRTNPEMWNQTTLEGVYRCRKPGGPTRLITYSTAYGVRASMLLAGFYVGDCRLPDGTMGGTEASVYPSDLANPLTPRWLSRWSHDRQPWPPMSLPNKYPQLRRALQEHPQWSQFASSDIALSKSDLVSEDSGRHRRPSAPRTTNQRPSRSLSRPGTLEPRQRRDPDGKPLATTPHPKPNTLKQRSQKKRKGARKPGRKTSQDRNR